MKKDIHPKWYPEAKIICDGEVVMVAGTTKPELTVELWSGNHPFYTGQQRLVDTEGQVDRFMKRLRRREEIRTEADEIAEAQSSLAWGVEEIGLPARAQNGLLSEGIDTVGKLLQRLEQGDDALIAVTGFGQKALIDVKKFLRSHGLMD